MAEDSADEALAVSTDEMMQELNLDTTDENKTVLSGLIRGAQNIVADSFTNNLSASMKADPMYIQAVKALTTAMWYDRSLSQGIPLGVEVMITHLQGRYDQWPEE